MMWWRSTDGYLNHIKDIHAVRVHHIQPRPFDHVCYRGMAAGSVYLMYSMDWKLGQKRGAS